MTSDLEFMTIFSMLMSLFVDLTPFMVRIYLHYHEEKQKMKEKKSPLIKLNTNKHNFKTDRTKNPVG